MNATETARIRAGYEPIAGYVLEEVIGRGGFGEVWRANAPGGIKKAVKFVFGAEGQTRAARERRSLERIKGVQHPFLLALERFEAVDDQLVIVTELADCSLEDVLRQSRERGSCGIPRETLISHMHDAAEALDYLHQKYQLQHLDIKPGNLLLVGGHVKVADFGLLKDMQDVEASVVGGLTPVYAPPEVFDGRPSLHSDQYSLAVMYQELLTGSRPFTGRTIAQLATQHVHSMPNLEKLPPADRPIVARALEKNPERRFPSCEAFVDALRHPHGTIPVGTDNLMELAQDGASDTASASEAAAAIEHLPRILSTSRSQSPTTKHHALVVALGGAGAKSLGALRERAADRHASKILELQSVLIDTDSRSLRSIASLDLPDHVPNCRLVHVPLRTAHEYRQNGTDKLSTISRRWIYNVPRSGSTEGMRPLGRLALVDHAATVTDELTSAVRELAASSDVPCSVYVVGSLAGGTASGAYVDVVHLLRHLLDQVDLADVPILSMLTIPSLQSDASRSLALHDTEAALTEIRHFMHAGNGYPGDVGAQWPSVPAGRTPLNDVYLVTDAPTGEVPWSASQAVAEYVWANATGAGELLANARKLEISEDRSIIPPAIRSVGVVPLGKSDQLERELLGPSVVREMLLRWLGAPSKSSQDAEQLSSRFVRRLNLSTACQLDNVTRELASEPSQQMLLDALSAVAMPHTDQASIRDAITPLLKDIIHSPTFTQSLSNSVSCLHGEVSVCLLDRRANVATMIATLKRLREDMAASYEQSIQASTDTPLASDSQSILKVAAEVVVAHRIEQIGAAIESLQERLDRFAIVLAQAISQLNQTRSNADNPWNEMPDPTRIQFMPTVLQLHDATSDRFLVRSLSQQSSSIDPTDLVQHLIEAVIPLVSAVCTSSGQPHPDFNVLPCDSDSVVSSSTTVSTATSIGLGSTASRSNLKSSFDAGDEAVSIDQAIAAIKPSLLCFGGRQRVLLVVGTEIQRNQLAPKVREACEGSVTVALIPGSSPKLIHEAQQIELANILSRLSILNGADTKITGRLASRCDVEW